MGFFLRLFFGGAIVSALGLYFLNLLESLDISRVIHNHSPGPCQFVEGIEFGSEDIAVLPSGIALLSTGLEFNRQNAHGKSALKSFNFSAPDQPARELKVTGFKGTLNPHGISLFQKGDKTYLYVVNHPPFNEHPPSDTVEKFLWEVEKGILVHKKTFTDPSFQGLNDLVVVSEDKFYISNFQVFLSKFMQIVEQFLLCVPFQNVVYYDGTKGIVVLEAMYGPNGINVSPDGKYLYLSEVNKRRVNSYRIESPTNLTLVSQRYLGSFPDNIDVHHETGELWIGAHPIGYQIMRKLMFGVGSPPSQVIRLGVKDGKFTTSKEIFADTGSHLSGSTIAVHSKGSLLIGTIEQKALVCKCLAC